MNETKNNFKKIINIFDSLERGLTKDEFVFSFSKERELNVKNTEGSLFNLVIIVDEYIIKYNIGNEAEYKKMQTEYNYYSSVGRECHISENGLIFKLQIGNLLTLSEINDKNNLRKISDLSNEINKIQLKFTPPELDLVEKYKNIEHKLLKKMNELNLESDILYEAISIYSKFEKKLIHSDLTEGNILKKDTEISFIDFGNLSKKQWIYEYVVLAADWNMNENSISYIVNEIIKEIKIDQFITLLLVYLVDVFFWNEERFRFSENKINFNKMNKIKSRINFIIETYK